MVTMVHSQGIHLDYLLGMLGTRGLEKVEVYCVVPPYPYSHL